MNLFHRAQKSDFGEPARALRIEATIAALIAVPAVLHALLPTSVVILQVFLDVCQFFVSVLRICGV